MANKRPEVTFLVAAVLCFINPAAAVVRTGFDTEPMGLVTQFIALLVAIPLISMPQLVAAFAIRNIRPSLAKWLLVALSLVTIADYVRFLLNVDLASSSTAGVALLFYPLMKQAIWFVPLSALAVAVGYIVDRPNTKGH